MFFTIFILGTKKDVIFMHNNSYVKFMDSLWRSCLIFASTANTLEEHIFFVYVLEKASSSSSGPLSWPAPRRVCCGHRQPICSAEHCNYRHREHSTERWQGAWHPGLGHGLHSDWRHHQCKTSPNAISKVRSKYFTFLTFSFPYTMFLSSMETQVAHLLTL